jgi:glycerol-3-phosphate acyltransferase PlsY
MKIILAAASYFLGAFPTGYLFFKISSRNDIRRFGSGATGATNVLRLKGWRLALPVALIDVAKGAVPALVAARMFGEPGFAALCASLAVVGHCYPVYIGFKGGKGVATAAGAMFALAPLPAVMCLAVFILSIAGTRFVSLGSILAASLFPVFSLLLREPRALILWSIPLVVVILARHGSNILRLLRGTEAKFGQKAASS